ncbi:hypothetical protein Hanom_Chr06g00555071 [Helianthus anomalus]
MNGSNVSSAVTSVVPAPTSQEGVFSTNVTTIVSSLAIRRSLNMEFDAEMLPRYAGGFVSGAVIGAGSSTQSTGLTQPLTASATTVVTLPVSHRVVSNTSLPMFTPAPGPRDYYYQPSHPVYTSAVLTTAQVYPPADNFQFPPLYSAALTVAMSTPPHKPIMMPRAVKHAPITPGKQAYVPPYYYMPPYSYMLSYMYGFGSPYEGS